MYLSTQSVWLGPFVRIFSLLLFLEFCNEEFDKLEILETYMYPRAGLVLSIEDEICDICKY